MVRTRTVRPNRTTQRVCLAGLSDYRIYTVKPDGTDLQVLFPKTLKSGEEPGYNAESVVSPDGKRVVFTSDRGGDLDIWVMNSVAVTRSS